MTFEEQREKLQKRIRQAKAMNEKYAPLQKQLQALVNNDLRAFCRARDRLQQHSERPA